MTFRKPLLFIKKHHIALLVIILSLIGAALFLYVTVTRLNAETATLRQTSLTEATKIDLAIKQIKKAAEAKRIAEQKAAAEVAEASAKATSPTDVTPEQAASCNISQAHSTPTQLDVIVNKKHCMKPINYSPSDLVTVYGATLTAAAAAQFEAMYLAATATGVPLSVTSSFRSYDNQVATYAHWVGVNGQAAADTVSARPGYSEHQTGLALDLAAGGCVLECFATTPQYTWLRTHAADYGFIERYPTGLTSITGYSPEAWHYRYVGAATAQAMKAQGAATLEQYWNISGGDYEG